MRTNIVIDDGLMRQALMATGLRTKREVVEEGLKTLVRARKQHKVLELRGMGWVGSLDEPRRDD